MTTQTTGVADASSEDLRLLDSTRPVIGNAGFGRGEGGEIFDIHPYYGWYHGNNTDWYRLARTLRESDAVGKPRYPATDDTTAMCPDRRAIIAGSTASMPCTTPIRLTRMSSWNTAGSND